MAVEGPASPFFFDHSPLTAAPWPPWQRPRTIQLYWTEFESFQAYCQAKRQSGSRYVDQLISAAQVLTRLRAISSHQKPEHET